MKVYTKAAELIKNDNKDIYCYILAFSIQPI